MADQPPLGAPGPIGGTPPIQPPTVTETVDASQVTVEKAWWQLMLRIGKHNPALYQSGGRALDTVNTLMRTHR